MNLRLLKYEDAISYNALQTGSLWIRRGKRSANPAEIIKIISINDNSDTKPRYSISFNRSRNRNNLDFSEHFVPYNGNKLVGNTDKEWLNNYINNI